MQLSLQVVKVILMVWLIWERLVILVHLQKASLIPIIPPSKGHGHDIYKELGSDRVLVFARFDTSTTNDFPVNTSFSQIGILKNPTSIGSTSLFTDPTFSSVGALKLSTANGIATNW